jgi:hypothetical protein
LHVRDPVNEKKWVRVRFPLPVHLGDRSFLRLHSPEHTFVTLAITCIMLLSPHMHLLTQQHFFVLTETQISFIEAPEEEVHSVPATNVRPVL